MPKDKKKDGYIYYVKKEKGAVSEFFNHMLAYGGFSVNDGVISVWGDPSVFTPLRAMVHIYDTLKQTTDQADSIMYWLGRLYGKNSTLILMKKFGFDKKKLPDFVNGATQDGFGYMEIASMKYNNKHLDLQMTGERSHLAINYAKLRGKQKNPVDHYLCGILSGGAEPLFDDFPIECHETKCMAQGAKRCEYQMNTMAAPPKFAFFKKLPFKEDYIAKKTRSMALKRKLNFSLFQRKNITFGDGSFILKGNQGFNMSVYEHIMLDKILLALLGQKKFSALKDEVARIIVEDTFDKTLHGAKMTAQNVTRMLQSLMSIGYGRLALARIAGNSCIIMSDNNSYMNDSREIFGGVNPLGVDLISKIVREGFKQYFGRDSSVQATPGFQKSVIRVSFSRRLSF